MGFWRRKSVVAAREFDLTFCLDRIAWRPPPLRRGSTVDTLIELQASTQADAIYFSRQYQPWSAGLEASINAEFTERNVEVRRYPGTLLHEPGSVLTGSGTSFKVFTPFWRAANKLAVAMPVSLPDVSWVVTAASTDALVDWQLQPSAQDPVYQDFLSPPRYLSPGT